jgi:hypothetical protein
MDRALILLFNHRVTPDQENDARENLGISKVVEPPDELRQLWGNVPPDLADLGGYLKPIEEWLAAHSAPGDYVLTQGDFGATYLMVKSAFKQGLIPIYSTTQREAAEEIQVDGSVKLIRRFRHKQFRKYGG